MNEQEFRELAAAFALHALTPEDEARFARARAEHPEWETIVDVDAATVAALAAPIAPVQPPQVLRDALLARIAVTPQHPVATPSAADARAGEPDEDDSDAAPTTSAIQTVERRRWIQGLLALAACLLLLVGVGFGAGALNQYLNRPPAVVALSEIEAAPDAQSASVAVDDGLTATAHWSASLDKAVLVTDGLPEISSEEDFQLWYVRGDTPISAGLFSADASGDATALLDGPIEEGDVIAVSVEPAGGSPTGAPTTEPLVTIPTA